MHLCGDYTSVYIVYFMGITLTSPEAKESYWY